MRRSEVEHPLGCVSNASEARNEPSAAATVAAQLRPEAGGRAAPLQRGKGRFPCNKQRLRNKVEYLRSRSDPTINGPANPVGSHGVPLGALQCTDHGARSTFRKHTCAP